MTFVSRDTDPAELENIRGAVFYARNKLDAQCRYTELHDAAKEAVVNGEGKQFLDVLTTQARADTSTAPFFDDFVDEWRKNAEQSSLSDATLISDKVILRAHLLPYFSKYRLDHITTRLVDQFKSFKRSQKHRMGDGYSAKTVNNMLSVLHRIFEKAIDYELVQKNPVNKKSWMREESTPEDNDNWWRPDEEAKAIATLRRWKETNPRYYLAILTQLVTGIRFSELRALQKGDLDFNTPGIWIRRSITRKVVGTPKNKRARFQVIPKELASELKEWMLRVPSQILFPGKMGNLMSNNGLNEAYKKLCEEAGIRRITSHGARHTSGSSYAMMGVGQRMIAHLLGHRHVGTTDRYTHVAVETTAPLVEKRWGAWKGEE